jgi:two-component system KDP operon response regulator KdpE
MKALIAESDCEVIDAISMAFSMCLPDFEVIKVESHKQCLNIVKENNLDIVILGGFPEISSFDVIEKIRNYSEVPVMFLSHIDEQSSLVKAFNAGADGYMTKPFQLFEFAARVKVLLKNKVQCEFPDQRNGLKP